MSKAKIVERNGKQYYHISYQMGAVKVDNYVQVPEEAEEQPKVPAKAKRGRKPRKKGASKKKKVENSILLEQSTNKPQKPASKSLEGNFILWVPQKNSKGFKLYCPKKQLGKKLKKYPQASVLGIADKNGFIHRNASKYAKHQVL